MSTPEKKQRRAYDMKLSWSSRAKGCFVVRHEAHLTSLLSSRVGKFMPPHGPGNRRGSGGIAPPTLSPGGGRRPSNFDEKMHFRNISVFFLFGVGIFKIKWPKSEEKLEFGGR